MNLVRRAAQQAGAGLSIADLDRMMDAAYGGAPTYSGKLVSPQTALAVSVFWSCVNVIAGDLATLPLLTYRRVGNARERATDHYLWSLLQDEANPEMSAYRFKRLLQAWVMLWGNAYAEVETNGRGQVTALWPWRPDHVHITREGSDMGPLQYSYRMKSGRVFTVPQSRMFHLRGLEIDGVTGISPVEQHRQTLGLSMAVTEHGARFFANGARPLGMLVHPQKLDDKAFNRIKTRWNEQHEGLSNAHRIAILEEGMEWKEAGADMVNAQYIETQKLTGEDVARICNVPQHRVGLLDRATNNNISQMSLEYVLYTLMPLGANWQSEIHFSMLSARELESVSTAFNYLHLLRGDFEAMRNFISVVRQWGILNADEVREMLLDLNPIPNGAGRTYWEPVNMMPAQTDASAGLAPQYKQIDPAASAPRVKPNGLAHRRGGNQTTRGQKAK